MPPKAKFTEGEKVLCYHGPLIYEAKCLKSSVTKDKQVKYFVHYAGWSKSWDEWVPESRVLKYNEANVAKQKEVQKNAPVKGKKTKAKGKTDANTSKVIDSRASTPVLETIPEKKTTTKTKQPSTPSSSSTDTSQQSEAPKKKRAKVEVIVEPDEEFVSKVEINIKIPEELKQLLVDDWDLINKQKKLWTLPSAKTVDDILDNYVKHMKSDSRNKLTSDSCESSVSEIVTGLKEYFNAIIHTQLLYKLERQQFAELTEEEAPPSRIYGISHLLRLFVRLGPNLAYTMLDDHNIQFLIEHVHCLLKYLHKHHAGGFSLMDSYAPTQEYLKKVV